MSSTRRDFIKVGAGALAATAANAPATAAAGRRHRRGRAPRSLPVGYPLGPFTRDPANPILRPTSRPWESRFVFNPAAIVEGGRIQLLYRAQGEDLRSSIGLATSSDGIHFRRREEPVLVATEPYELPGGCEDPRVVRIGRTYYMTYTGYDGTSARLCLATSRDLVHWTKHGPMFADFETRGTGKPWSKSGAILTRPVRDPATGRRRYVMYFGDKDIYYAWSDDLIHWTPGPVDAARHLLGRAARAGAAAADHRERLHPAHPQLGRPRPRRQARLPRRAGADRPGRPDHRARPAHHAVPRARDAGGDGRPGEQRRVRRGPGRPSRRVAALLRHGRRGRRRAARRVAHALRLSVSRRARPARRAASAPPPG
jgi:hypothetical protein